MKTETTHIANFVRASFEPTRPSDLLFSNEPQDYFKNKHSSHICFVDDDTGGGGNDDTGGAGNPPSLLGDETDGGGSDETGGKDETGDGKNKSSEEDPEKKDRSNKESGEGAPETYELDLPDGMELDTEALEIFEPLFRELNLTNEQASKLASTYGEYNKSAAETAVNSAVEQLEKQFFDTNTEWQKQINEDPEYGGTNIKENLNIARSVIDRFTENKDEATALRNALKETGAGNHPEMMRLMYRVGKAIAEDKLSNASGGEKDESAKRFYPNSPELK